MTNERKQGLIMKAKIKPSGRIAEIESLRIKGSNRTYYPQELDILPIEPDWQQVRIQAAIAAMQGLVSNEIHLNHADKVAEEKGINTSIFLAKCAIEIADALVAVLKHSEDVYAECRRLDSINTASVCENMTKIQNELQKKDDNADV